MRGRDLLASAAIHAAALGAAVTVDALLCNPGQEPEIIPICFEIVEEEAVPESMHEIAPPAQEPLPDIPPLGDAAAGDAEAAEVVADEIQDMSYDDIPDVPDEYIPDAPETTEEQPERQASETAKPESAAAVRDKARDERAQVVSDPVALNRIVPSYPRSARRKGHEGSVTVEITVAADGLVGGAEIVGSSGHAELDAAALDAARTAHFAPATVDGATVSGRLRLTFDFRLK